MDVGMQHSGIGGGGFMLIRDSDGNYESIGESLDSILEKCTEGIRLSRNGSSSGI
jgi:hypothetical protein